MQLKDLFLSIPRSTLETLTRHHLLRPNILLWYDLIRFFDSLDLSDEAQHRRISKYLRPLGQMDKYTLTANRFHLSEDQTRHIIARLNTPISQKETTQPPPPQR